MAMDPQELAARARADRAREQLFETLAELQNRLNPRTIARNAWDNAVDRGQNAWDVAVDRGADIAEDAAIFVKARPTATAAGLSAILGLLAIPKLVRAFRKPPPAAALDIVGPDIVGQPLWLAPPVAHQEKQS